MVGKTLGHYRIKEKIGAGGMGEVYRAHDQQLDRDVAIKVLPANSFSDPTARARLLREARAAAALNHPYICTIHEVGEAEGQAYIAMELVNGLPLNLRLAGRALPEEQALGYGLQLAEALAHAHERGVVHRDLKSANVIITSEARVKVLDFGLAKRLSGKDLPDATTQQQDSLTQPGALVGTLAYMAPEQLRGQPADARSDVWALGVVLYEMVNGTHPFQGQTGFELSSAILNQRPTPLPAKVSLGLRALIERCLEKEPARRYQRGGEVHAALEGIQTGTGTSWVAWRYQLARRRWLALAVATVALLLVVAALNAGRLRTWFFGAANTLQINSLAVLPLENLSGDPGQEYFADGMTEALITELAQLKGLKRVVARGSVMRYKRTGKSFPEIARELQVDALITGAVLRSGDRVRVTAQLINPANEEQIWAERYERDLRDVLSLQSDVTRAIASQIRVKLTPQERARLTSARAVNPEAHEAYLKGVFYYNKLSANDLRTALEYFQLALEKDPNYALAYVGIGTFWLGSAHAGLMPTLEALPKGKVAVLKAIALDDTLAEAHDMLGGINMYWEWDWPAAEKELLRARELSSNSGCTPVIYADLLLLTGRREEARAEIQRCLEMDPLNSWLQAAFGGRLLRLERYDEGIVQLQKALKTDPNLGLAHRYLWVALDHKQMYGEAVAEATTYLRLVGYGDAADALARGYAEAGYPAAMKRAADKLAARAKLTYVQPTQIAAPYAYAGEKDQAFQWLDKAYEKRDSWLVFVKDDPRFESLQADARFQDLLRRMNIPQ